MFECKRFISFCFQGYVGFLSGSDELRGRLTNQDLKKLFGNVTSIHLFNRCALTFASPLPLSFYTTYHFRTGLPSRWVELNICCSPNFHSQNGFDWIHLKNMNEWVWFTLVCGLIGLVGVCLRENRAELQVFYTLKKKPHNTRSKSFAAGAKTLRPETSWTSLKVLSSTNRLRDHRIKWPIIGWNSWRHARSPEAVLCCCCVGVARNWVADESILIIAQSFSDFKRGRKNMAEGGCIASLHLIFT